MKHNDLLNYLWTVIAPIRLGIEDSGDQGTALNPSTGAGGDGDSSSSDESGTGGDDHASTDQRTFMDQDGKFTNPKWAGEGGENMAKKFSSLGALTKSYAHLERQLGNSNKVSIPNENSPQEDWDSYHKATGRPDTAEGYELKRPDTIDEANWNETEATEFSNIAHELGLSKDQATKLANWQGERVSGALTANTEEQVKMQQETVAGLKDEWGADYDSKIDDAKRGAMSAGGQELVDHPLAANDPVVIRAMAKIGAMISEDGGVAIRGEGASKTGSSIDEQIASVRKDQSHPYHHQGHPDHDKAVARMDSLYQRKFPSKDS